MTNPTDRKNYIEFRVYLKDGVINDLELVMKYADSLQDLITNELDPDVCETDIFTQDVTYEVKTNG